MKRTMHPVRQWCAGLGLLAAIGFAAGAAQAQSDASYPSKSVRFIVPFPGVTENLGRAVAQSISTDTGQPVIVEMRPGTNGIPGAQFASKQPADGYTVLFTTNTTTAGNAAIYPKLPYDPFKDFAPVSGIGKGALIYIASNSLGVSNIAELVALAKKKPGAIVFGWAGSSGRAAIEMLNIAEGLKMRDIPYKTPPQALNDLVGGQIDLLVYGEVGTAQGLARAGKLRVLGMSTSERLDIAPDVPTVREQGFPDFEMTYWVAVYVPSGTPTPIINRLNGLVGAAMKTEKLRDMVRSAGMLSYVTTPEGLAKFQAAEADKWRRIVTAAGMQEKE